ncbi:hypothetical protein SPRG_17867 [Saprolegnia parasitica CBS 223.65]|uniref:Metalloendopeptidase n=1 Tax=Saprolegnia parasitica (strain CBS 223.65) TaxID=695850 RepID=A0A067BPK7_SAPPC|nr:hypothetical protein SPRG_17867 [Saprolegnia parasitica CBS 223.65]KDO16632.1 hypothetical protein SPRG_17867 [Saprolegnia parasitica CBS 223.65]|eukprot:XP_012212660.1 hypothetical protein SPRG_17867 [Saprolegnia parasitica CBS 223.65]
MPWLPLPLLLLLVLGLATADDACHLPHHPTSATTRLSGGQIEYIFGQPREPGAIYRACVKGVVTCFEDDGNADGDEDDPVSCHKADAQRRLGLATQHTHLLWPLATLCYQIESPFTLTEMDVIQNAMNGIVTPTGVSMLTLDECKASPRAQGLCGGCAHYVSIHQRPHRRGTYAAVGYLQKAGQDINLQPSAFKHGSGTIMHEMLHAFGVSHEHVHPASEAIVLRGHKLAASRNNYVLRREAFVTQYDKHSIMHYGHGVCLPKNKSVKYCNIEESEADGCVVPTAADCDEEASSVLGQRDGMSPGDIRTLQVLYELPTTMTQRDVSVDDDVPS